MDAGLRDRLERTRLRLMAAYEEMHRRGEIDRAALDRALEVMERIESMTAQEVRAALAGISADSREVQAVEA